jgi:hypothetical protein
LVIYPLVLSERETLAAAHRGASLARYGDGELKLALDRDAKSQHGDQGLAKRLRQILAAPTGACLVCIPNIESKTPKAEFWAQYKADRYVRLYRGPRLAVGPAYGSSFITRPDSAPWIDVPEYWAAVVDLWRGQDVVLVRGSSKSLTAADLVDARSVDEQIASRQHAWRIMGAHGQLIGEKRRVFLCLGATATVLAFDLAAEGVHALDLGHVGMFLRKEGRFDARVSRHEGRRRLALSRPSLGPRKLSKQEQGRRAGLQARQGLADVRPGRGTYRDLAGHAGGRFERVIHL